MDQNQLQHTLSYLSSELNRIQTVAGTLSTVEEQHYKELTNFGDDKLNQIATEEQNAARQLGEIKQTCLTLAQKIADLNEQNG